jgi:Bardet-Biedl syndrome 2 protein
MFPIAQYETHENSIPLLTAVGNFTGSGHCFAAAASAKRLYTFDTTEPPDKARSYVKIGQKITCIQPCDYDDHEALVLGTDNSVQLFDVKSNSQVFCTLIEDGASAVVVFQKRGIYVGSNCTILGYDFQGAEIFWTVTGDVVTAMCEITWDGKQSILAASQDLMIRLFQGEESIRERRVKSKVSILKPLGPNKYAIAFESGSIMLIDGASKVWDVSAGGQIIGLQMIDYAGAGKADIAFATSEGTIGILATTSGHLTLSDDTHLNLSGLHLFDFKDDGHLCLLVIGTGGSVRVFMPNRTEGLGVEARREFDLRQAQPTLVKEKAKLLLREFELTQDMNNLANPGSDAASRAPKVTAKYSLGQRKDLGCAELRITTEPPTPIQGSVIECPTTSGGDSIIFETNVPAEPTQHILLNFPDDATGSMKIDVFFSANCYSFSCNYQKFFGFMLLKEGSVKPTSYAEFTDSGGPFGAFVSQSFIVGNPLGSTFQCCFQSLSSQEPVVLFSDGRKCQIRCEKVETAARIITEYCDFATIEEFECLAHFPHEIEALMQAAQEDNAMSDTNLVHKAEVAGLIAGLKDLVVRVENSEILGQYDVLYESVLECERLNGELAREHQKRMTNREVAGSGNQKLNGMIQRFAELRKGNARTSLLQICRKALQARDFKKLAYFLEHGRAVA